MQIGSAINHNFIKEDLFINPDFEKPLKIPSILAKVNKTLHKYD